MKFRYYVELKEGYMQTMQDEAETEIRFDIEAKNRVTAHRAVTALLKGAENVAEYGGYAVMQEAQDTAEADDRIGQQLEEFLQTEVGEEMKETIRLWDRVLTRQEGEKKDHASNVCGAKWEVFKMFLKQLYGIEFFFTRTDEYFGICTEDERIFLMKEQRGGAAR